MKRDIANATSLYPVVIKAKPFKNLHNVLLRTIKGFFGHRTARKGLLLVLGLSPTFSPFADDMQCLEMIAKQNGSIVGIDYNLSVIEECFIYLHKKNVFELFKPALVIKNRLSNGFIGYLNKNNFSIDDVLEKNQKETNPQDLENNTMLLIEHDLKDGLYFSKNSFDFIDATLTLHHIAAYKEKYLELLKEIYAVLNPKGIFHLGEGFVDMRSSERKINEIVKSLKKDKVIVEDKRDETHPVYLKYEDRKKEFLSNAIQKKDICIDKNGIVKINSKTFPLMSKKDVKHYNAINNFYDASIKEIKKVNHPLAKKAAERAEEERKYALAGLVEYYSPLQFHKKMLIEAGFRVRIIRPNLYLKGLAEFGNLVCTK